MIFAYTVQIFYEHLHVYIPLIISIKIVAKTNGIGKRRVDY